MNVKDEITQDQIFNSDQIVTFVDDVASTSFSEALQREQSWVSSSHDQLAHDIAGILSRPKVMEDFTITQTPGPFNFKFPGKLFTQNANLVNKLNYFTYLKADLVFRIVYNATPFMQGKYWMFYTPYEEYTNRPVTTSLPNATGYTGIEVDLNVGSPVELRVPFISPLSHMNLIRGEGNFGILYLQPLAKLASGDAGVVDATLFAWFENIELSVPSNEVVNTTKFNAQVFQGEAIQPTTVLSKIAQPVVRWASNWATSALNNIGWSKPNQSILVNKFVNVPAAGYTNYNSPDNCVKLAYDQDNSIQPDDKYFGNTEDEMDILYICKRFNVCADPIEWNTQGTNSAVGDVLYNFPVNPGFCPINAIVYEPTQLAYVSSMFEKWRGTLRYRFSVAKTAFQTGRLRISYIPYNGGVLQTTTNQDFCYTWILDLSKSSELTIDIPYVGNTLWQTVSLGPLGTTSRFGNVVVSILTTLKSPNAAAANQVTIVPWIAAGDDFQLAVPNFESYVPAINYYQTPPTSFSEPLPSIPPRELDLDNKPSVLNDEDREIFKAQIFGSADLVTTKGEDNFKGGVQDPMFPCKSTIGERVTNLRTLTRRYGMTAQTLGPIFKRDDANAYSVVGPFPLVDSTASPTDFNSVVARNLDLDTAYFGSKTYAVPDPSTITMPISVSTIGDINSDLVNAVQVKPCSSPLNYISYLYRFYRGGRRYKLFTGPSGNRSTLASNLNSSAFTGGERDSIPYYVRTVTGVTTPKVSPPIMNKAALNTNPGNFSHVVYPDLSGVIEFEAPFYSDLPLGIVREGDAPTKSAGPLLNRSVVRVSKGLTVNDCLLPFTTTPSGVASPTVSAFWASNMGKTTVFEAAADDFSFGYLVGAQRLILNLEP